MVIVFNCVNYLLEELVSFGFFYVFICNNIVEEFFFCVFENYDNISVCFDNGVVREYFS